MARKYDHEYKVQAVKLAKEIGGAKAAKELGIPEGTIHTWLKAVRAGKLDIGEGSHTPTIIMRFLSFRNNDHSCFRCLLILGIASNPPFLPKIEKPQRRYIKPYLCHFSGRKSG